MQKELNFTKKALLELPPAEKGKRYTVKDTKEHGLILRVSDVGNKVFALYKKYQGRPVKITFGKFPDLSVENARKMAQLEKAKLIQGINTNDIKRNFKQESTLKDLFEEYMIRYSKKEKKSWEYDEREIPKHLGHWFNRKLSTLRKQEIMRYHDKIRDENGLYQANRMLERLRAMYNKAIEWGWDGTNPTNGIKKFKETKRDRFIHPAEMPFFFKALEQEENETARDYLNILLLTGARKTNTLQMRWEDIDFEQKIWRIPDTKNGEPVVLPLVERALEILQERRSFVKSRWVFPSHESNRKHFADPKKSWNRIRQHATIMLWLEIDHLKDFVQDVLDSMPYYILSIPETYRAITKKAEKDGVDLPTGMVDIRLHDIRRTFGSFQAITGSSLQVIGKSLGHKSMDATQIYARLHTDPIRESMETAINKMYEFKNDEEEGNE